MSRYVCRKGPWRDLEVEARSQGWVVAQRANGHLAWRSPRGSTVYSSATPSDSKAWRRHRSLLRRHGLEV